MIKNSTKRMSGAAASDENECILGSISTKATKSKRRPCKHATTSITTSTPAQHSRKSNRKEKAKRINRWTKLSFAVKKPTPVNEEITTAVFYPNQKKNPSITVVPKEENPAPTT